ncbi:MAG: hypothetical protein GF418_01995 [Chitinivibrionales bacterium]|nr:hypothetical protein [Chitinivibrionales bacterium]MBD3394372.1 hypothetical protein [Chitinivibrionales bacterium]
MKSVCQRLVLIVVPALVAGAPLDSIDATAKATWKPDSSDSVPPPGQSWAVIGELEGIKGKVVKYNTKLFRGGPIVSDAGGESLKKLGVKTIITIAPARKEREIARRAGLELVEIPFGNDRPVPDDLIDFFTKTVQEKQGPFYVHCTPPGHRSGVLLAEYRVRTEKWTCERAVLEFKDLGGDTKAAKEMLKPLLGPPETE